MSLQQDIAATIARNGKITTRDNSDMAMMGDTRGDTLYAIDNTDEIAVEIMKLVPTSDDIIKRLDAAEALIEGRGTYNWDIHAEYRAYKVWYNLKYGKTQS